MMKFIKTFLKFFGQALISAALVFILISAPVRKVLSVVKYTLDSSDILSGLTSTGVFTIGSDAVDSFLRLYPTDTVPCAQEGAMYYDCSSVEVKFYNGTSWIGLAESAEASGQIVMFDSACPSGWTEVTAFQNVFPRGHDGDATYCETGGSDSHCHNVSFSCTTAECGAHCHTTGCIHYCVCGDIGCKTSFTYTHCHVSSTWYMTLGGESSVVNMGLCGCHAHSYSGACGGTSASSNIPAYREVVFCKKD